MSDPVSDAATPADGAEHSLAQPQPDEGDLNEQPMPARSRRIAPLTLLLAAVFVAIDQLTKHWALQELADGDEIHLFWTLQFNLAYNSGMAFSRGRGLGPVIGVFAILVVVVLVIGTARLESLLARIAAGMLLGGAIGNLADRMFREEGWLHGRVIDFIDPQWFPIFNVADIGVTVGAILFILSSLLLARAEDRAVRAAAVGAGTDAGSLDSDSAGSDGS